MAQQRADETQILFPPGHKFSHGEVVDFEAKSGGSAGVLAANRNEPVPPTRGQYRGFFTDAVRIVTEGLMKWGSLADTAIDQFGIDRATVPTPPDCRSPQTRLRL